MRQAHRNGGFTMIEVMIAVAIIGVLASVAIPTFQNYQNRSKRSEAFANLSAIAKLETSYYGEYDAFLDMAGAPQPGGGLGATKRAWSPAAVTAFSTIGFLPEGDVFYDYDVDTCAPIADCFTVTGVGDADANLAVALIQYVHPSAAGVTVPSAIFAALGIPIDLTTAQPIYNAVAVNYGADFY